MSVMKWMRTCSLAVVLASAGACSHARKSARVGDAGASDSGVTRTPTSGRTDVTTGTKPPLLIQLAPESSRVERGSVVTLTLRGSGFQSTETPGNTVEIGPVLLNGVSADSGGRIIRVVIPDRVVSPGEAPPRRLLPGDYSVIVSTPAGKSNALTFRVLP